MTEDENKQNLDEQLEQADDFSGSFDDKEFLEAVNKDEFQKELDKAIEQRNLAEFLHDHSAENGGSFLGLYKFDAETLEYEFTFNDVVYKHRVKNPGKEVETRKEAMSVTIRKSAGKVDGDDTVAAFNDNGNALKKYYDSVAVEIFGYPNELDLDADPDQWQSVITIIEERDKVSDEERKRFGLKRDEDLKVLNLIPDADKLEIAAKIHAGQCIVIHEKGKRVRSMRSKREYVVKQLFGVVRNDDGTLSKPKHVVAYHFDEAGASAITKFDAYAIPSRTRIKTEGVNEEHRIISIPTCDALFDAHINFIQGGEVNGEEVLSIQKGDARLEKIPSACKRESVIIYFNFLKNRK